MPIQFRTAGPDDADSIAALMQQVFGMDAADPCLNREQMEWKYWRKHPWWDGSRSFVIEQSGAIVAHGAVIPMICAWENKKLRIANLIDWVARRDCPGVGIALRKHIHEMADGVFAVAGTEMTTKILPALGYQEVARASRFAFPLRPLARMRHDSLASGRAWGRLGRNLLWKMRAPSAPPRNWGVRRLSPPDVLRTPFPTPLPRAGEALFLRDPLTITDLLACPTAPGEFYLVEREQKIRGYFVLLKAVNQARIVETWMDTDQPGDWRALYTLAIRQAALFEGITEVVTVISGREAEIEGLRLAGMHAREQVPLRLWTAADFKPASFRYQLADGDAGYLHDNRLSFWI